MVAEFERHEVEEILTELDSRGGIFRDVELCRDGDGLILLGKGGMGWVFEASERSDPKTRYALKVIGLNSKNTDGDDFENTVRWQTIVENDSRHVCSIIDSRQLCVELGGAGHVISAHERERTDLEENSTIIKFILFEKLREVIGRDRFGNCFISCQKLADGGECEVVRFALQIGQVLLATHRRHILHRDIKLENVFWDEQQDVYKLSDFGFAKWTESEYAVTKWGTDGYVAPEIRDIEVHKYSYSADIYSFGITLYRLLNDLQYPGGEDFVVNPLQYDEKFIFPAPKNASPDMARLINRMCKYNRLERMSSMQEVMSELKVIADRISSETEIVYEELYDYINPAADTFCVTNETKARTVMALEDTTGGRMSDYMYQKKLMKTGQRVEKLGRIATVWLTIALLSFLGTSAAVNSVIDNLMWYHLLIPPAIILYRKLLKHGESEAYPTVSMWHWYVTGRDITVLCGLFALAISGYSIYMTGITIKSVVIWIVAFAILLLTNVVAYSITAAVGIVLAFDVSGSESLLGLLDGAAVRVIACLGAAIACIYYVCEKVSYAAMQGEDMGMGGMESTSDGGGAID